MSIRNIAEAIEFYLEKKVNNVRNVSNMRNSKGMSALTIMGKAVAAILLPILIAVSGAAAEPQAVYLHGQFQKDSRVHLFADKVNLRAAPSTTAAVVKTLPAGSELTIIGEPENTLKTNGYSSGWYKVLFVDQQKKFTGHIWGGLLSLGAVQFEDEDGQALFVAGVTGAAEGRFAGEARIIEDGEISAKLPFTWISTSMGEETNYSYSITIEELPWAGISDLKRLFQVNCNYEACGYTRGNLLFFWDGKNLIAGPSAEGVSEAGVFSVNSEFIFPGQEGRKPGELMVRTVTVESADPESSTPASARKHETLYVWSGKAWSGQEPVETTIPVPSPPAMDEEGAEDAADDQDVDANNASNADNDGNEGQ